MDLENLFRENFEEELLCRFIVRGKKDERYILCKTDSGIRLIPYTVNKDRVFSADCENSVFLAEEDIKKVSLVKSDLVYKIKIRQEDGKTFKLKASRKVKADASHKENVKKFRKIYKKTCRRAQNLERLEIVIGIILAVVIGSHAFIYSFTHFAAKNIDGNELIEYAKSEGKDQMFMSPDMYNKTDLKLSGETQNYENAVYSLELPADMKMNEEYPNSDFSDGYTSPDNRFHLSLVKEGFSTEEEMTLLEQIMIHYYKVATSSKCKKYFGFKPDSSYNYEKIARSINFNNLDVNDSDMCFVYSIFSMQKMTTISPLIGNAKYIVETEDYCGFISENYLEGKDDGKDNCIISFDMYSTDDLNMQYNISFIINDYTEEDIETAYAIINSLEMK